MMDGRLVFYITIIKIIQTQFTNQIKQRIKSVYVYIVYR